MVRKGLPERRMKLDECAKRIVWQWRSNREWFEFSDLMPDTA